MDQSDRLRVGICLLLPLTLILPRSLPAQEAADTVPEPVAISDSLPNDTTQFELLRPTWRVPGSGNPYLREVDESPGSPYYATLSVGAGSEAIAALGPRTPFSLSRTRPTLSLGVGFNVSQQLRLGVDGFAWFNAWSNGQLETVTALLFGGRAYPIPGVGLYLRAGGGLGMYIIGDYDLNCSCMVGTTRQFGLAWVLGGGFELPVSRSLSIGPMFDMVRFNVTGPDGYRERVLNMGISFTVDGH